MGSDSINYGSLFDNPTEHCDQSPVLGGRPYRDSDRSPVEPWDGRTVPDQQALLAKCLHHMGSRHRGRQLDEEEVSRRWEDVQAGASPQSLGQASQLSMHEGKTPLSMTPILQRSLGGRLCKHID